MIHKNLQIFLVLWCSILYNFFQFLNYKVKCPKVFFRKKIASFVFIDYWKIFSVNFYSSIVILSLFCINILTLKGKLSVCLVFFYTWRFNIREFFWIEFLFDKVFFEHGFQLIFWDISETIFLVVWITWFGFIVRS